MLYRLPPALVNTEVPPFLMILWSKSLQQSMPMHWLGLCTFSVLFFANLTPFSLMHLDISLNPLTMTLMFLSLTVTSNQYLYLHSCTKGPTLSHDWVLYFQDMIQLG